MAVNRESAGELQAGMKWRLVVSRGLAVWRSPARRLCHRALNRRAVSWRWRPVPLGRIISTPHLTLPQNAHGEDLFEYYATSQLGIVDTATGADVQKAAERFKELPNAAAAKA